MEDKNEIGFYLKKINDFLLMRANEHLKKLDLTFSQLHVLMYILNDTNATVLQKEIEQHFKLKHPTVVGLLKRMEKKNLISIEENPEDRRGNRVTALPKGIALEKEIVNNRKYTDEFLTCDLDEKQKSDLKNLLRIVYTKTCMSNYNSYKK